MVRPVAVRMRLSTAARLYAPAQVTHSPDVNGCRPEPTRHQHICVTARWDDTASGVTYRIVREGGSSLEWLTAWCSWLSWAESRRM